MTDDQVATVRRVIERGHGQDTINVTPDEHMAIQEAVCELGDLEFEFWDDDNYEPDTRLNQIIREVFAEHDWPAREHPLVLMVRK